MSIYLRQICLVARDLAPVQADLQSVFSLEAAYHDDAVAKWGLENVLLPIGTQFLEVVAPTQPGTAAGRYLDRRGGDGGYMVITQVPTRDEQDAARDRAAARDVRVAYSADRGDWNIMQLHPRDLKAGFFEIDWDIEADPNGRWMPAGGHDWKDAISTQTIDAITSVALQSDDPAALADLWAHVAGVPVVMDGPTPTVALANATLSFIPDTDGRGPGLSGLTVRATDIDRLHQQADARNCRGADGTITVCGTRFQTT